MTRKFHPNAKVMCISFPKLKFIAGKIYDIDGYSKQVIGEYFYGRITMSYKKVHEYPIGYFRDLYKNEVKRK